MSLTAPCRRKLPNPRRHLQSCMWCIILSRSKIKTNPRVVREMVNRLVLAATGRSDVAKAWASLVSPNDRIGIKISAAGGELFTTHHDVVNAIVDGLVAAGHSRGSIIVWDRSLGGIKDAG